MLLILILFSFMISSAINSKEMNSAFQEKTLDENQQNELFQFFHLKFCTYLAQVHHLPPASAHFQLYSVFLHIIELLKSQEFQIFDSNYNHYLQRVLLETKIINTLGNTDKNQRRKTVESFENSLALLINQYMNANEKQKANFNAIFENSKEKPSQYPDSESIAISILQDILFFCKNELLS